MSIQMRKIIRLHGKGTGKREWREQIASAVTIWSAGCFSYAENYEGSTDAETKKRFHRSGGILLKMQ